MTAKPPGHPRLRQALRDSTPFVLALARCGRSTARGGIFPSGMTSAVGDQRSSCARICSTNIRVSEWRRIFGCLPFQSSPWTKTA